MLGWVGGVGSLGERGWDGPTSATGDREDAKMWVPGRALRFGDGEVPARSFWQRLPAASASVPLWKSAWKPKSSQGSTFALPAANINQ